MKSTGVFTRVEKNHKLYGVVVVVEDSETGTKIEFPLPTEALWHMIMDCQKLEDMGYTEFLAHIKFKKRYNLSDTPIEDRDL